MSEIPKACAWALSDEAGVETEVVVVVVVLVVVETDVLRDNETDVLMVWL